MLCYFLHLYKQFLFTIKEILKIKLKIKEKSDFLQTFWNLKKNFNFIIPVFLKPDDANPN